MAGRRPHPIAAIRRNPRLALICVVVALLPIALAAAAWVYMESHQLVPGMGGCRFIRNAGPQIACYTNSFEEIVDKHGLKRALVMVDDEAEDGAITVRADCHLAWHPIGEADGRTDAKAGRPFEEFDGATTCQEGYAHGYTIGYLGGDNASVERMIEVAEGDCATEQGENAVLNCMHAIGHTLARRKAATEKSVDAICERIDHASIAALADVKDRAPDRLGRLAAYVRFQCSYGAQMEFGLLDLQRGSKKINTCGNEPSHVMTRACYGYLPSRATALGNNLDAGAKACEKYAPIGEMREVCVINYALGLNETWRCDALRSEGSRNLCHSVREQTKSSET